MVRTVRLPSLAVYSSLQTVGMSYSRNLFCQNSHCSTENHTAAVRALFPTLFLLSFLAYYTVQMLVVAYNQKPPIPGCVARRSTTP